MRDGGTEPGGTQDAAALPLVFRRFYGAFHEEIRIRIFECGNFHHGHAHALFKRLDVELIPVLFEDVRHIQRHDQRNIHFHELRREIEISFEVGRVHDIDDAIRPFVEDEISRDDLFGRIGRKGIDPGQVYDVDMLPVFFISSLALVYGDARPVSHVRRASRQSIEQSRFSRIRVSGQSKF